jgi:cytidylate kinase
MSVITISRQMGSLGSEIAFQVAEMLGYKVIWRELINNAALRAGAPEAALAAIDELGLLGICPSPQDCRRYRQAVEEILHELAAGGNIVIIGRAGQIILASDPDTLHVRIMAPFSLRVERVAQRLKIADSFAQAQVETSDRYRANYMRRFYHVRWDDPSHYHLVINTALLDSRQAAELIRQACTLLHNEPSANPLVKETLANDATANEVCDPNIASNEIQQ